MAGIPAFFIFFFWSCSGFPGQVRHNSFAYPSPGFSLRSRLGNTKDLYIKATLPYLGIKVDIQLLVSDSMGLILYNPKMVG